MTKQSILLSLSLCLFLLTHLLEYVNVIGVVVVGKVEDPLGGIGAQVIKSSIAIRDTAGLGALRQLILLRHGGYKRERRREGGLLIQMNNNVRRQYSPTRYS